MIKGNVIFSEKASEDIRAVVKWYEDEKAGLSIQFLKEADNMLNRVKKQPSAFRYI